ncbi:class I SAM-dependent methyltransferase [Solwaraspora sp. WMMD1047]|uniref:class I SAM-dependent methyltransferase n=1 Tax=Solwaraspora sp. WMMD1047 TaxID=3016102 RepID=UPI002415CE27|nr:class I SAM-dependent methyltransferase [Solwaraspora sp. WMMD1047]MDG4834846.1 class I SAM-dependent methyltransferase [Solwaraspora sp. WMMD1047]
MTYLFHDADQTERERTLMMRALAGMYDPFSRQQLRSLALPANARCLVVAVGASTIASTLAEMAPAGEVIATDIDLDPCHTDRRVQLIHHNIVTDPLPGGGPYHLVHVRLLLGHLPQRHDVLATLADALAPGGVLIIEEFEPTWRTSVLTAPDLDEADRLFTAYHDAFHSALTASRNDPTWGRRVHHAMRNLGLDTTTTGHTATWTGGSHGCLLPHAAAAVLRRKLINAGMPPADIDAFRDLLTNPELAVKGNLALSTIGRRPH